MTERSDPWATIDRPPTTRAVSARRADPKSPWPLFRGLDTDGRRLLMLQHSPATPVTIGLPRFRDMEMEHRRPGGEEPDFLLLRLLQPDYSEVFLEFCSDLIRVTNRAETEAEAISRFIGRAWTWQRFLATRRSGRLTPLEQMGLIGELYVLCEVLFPVLGPVRAVAAWNGPLGAAVDLESDGSAIEVKAVSGATSKVRISSEHQLSTDDLSHLFLCAVEVVRTDGDEATTVSAAAKAVRDTLSVAHPVTLDDFERRLRATGFDWSDDYSDSRWRIGGRRCFEVAPGFPRIIPGTLPTGLSAVRYSLALSSCGEFAVTKDAVVAAFRRA